MAVIGLYVRSNVSTEHLIRGSSLRIHSVTVRVACNRPGSDV